MNTTKTLTILGSTGSIGTQSVDVALKRGYKVAALTADTNAALIEQQARLLTPEAVALRDERAAADLKVRLADTGIKVLSGMEGVCECAALPSADTAVNAIVGIAGLRPTLAAIDAGKKLALANKETIVAGGSLVLDACRAHDIKILPIDSEHSAIFQCLQASPPGRKLKKIILTASGGPFFGKTRGELKDVTAEQALKHPNWSMGAKITIDSATMFNKGLELIEAVRLFDVKPEDVHIVVHRESIVHSAVEFCDNSIIAQLGLPDMRIPIQYALTYPERFPSPVDELDLAAIGKLSFFEPDYDTFRCIDICRRAVKQDGLITAAVNSANEAVNLAFRQGRIRFNDIPDLIERASQEAPAKTSFTADDIEAVDGLMRETVESLILK